MHAREGWEDEQEQNDPPEFNRGDAGSEPVVDAGADEPPLEPLTLEALGAGETANVESASLPEGASALLATSSAGTPLVDPADALDASSGWSAFIDELAGRPIEPAGDVGGPAVERLPWNAALPPLPLDGWGDAPAARDLVYRPGDGGRAVQLPWAPPEDSFSTLVPPFEPRPAGPDAPPVRYAPWNLGTTSGGAGGTHLSIEVTIRPEATERLIAAAVRAAAERAEDAIDRHLTELRSEEFQREANRRALYRY